MHPKILVIEDDKNIQKLLHINLSEEQFQVFEAMDGVTGLNRAKELRPDAVVLDINLPKMSGIEVCKYLKSAPETKQIPVIMLTVRKEEVDKILGFEIGADDYVTKPFSPRELILRLRAVLRRKEEPVALPAKIEAGDIALDEARFEVRLGPKPVPLTAREFKLLKFFLLNRERLLSREALLHSVWGYASDVDTRTVDAHIKSLRKKLPSKKVKIQTIVGMGYKLTANV